MPFEQLNQYNQIATTPSFNQPLQTFKPMGFQQQPADLTRVNGIESARAYPTVPNSRYVLFDENDDVFYIKQTDASNFPTITRYKFYREDIDSSKEKYVTMEEFEKFKEEILNGKQFVWTNNNKSKRNQPNKGYDANASIEQQS